MEIWEATWHLDCNTNGVDDLEEIESGEATDWNEDGIPDGCQGVNPPRFKRGEANGDVVLNTVDAIFILGCLFARTAPPSCLDAGDVNDDGRADIADPIAFLSNLFASAGPLPAPFGSCGMDPTDDELDCGSFPPCEGP